MSPTASIVIPSRGGADRLPHLFAALAAQTTDDWEAIVVIDGDIDNSAAVVAEAGRDQPIRAIVLDRNRGRSVALNTGFEAATGTVLIRCDDDLRPAPNWVADHCAPHANGLVGIVGLYRNVFPDTAYARIYGRPRDERFRADAYRTPVSLHWRFWAGNVSASRELWQEVGPYDIAYRAYGWEDIDWGYRAHRAGADIQMLPTLETDHHIAATTTAVRVARSFHSGAAKMTFQAKHGPVLPSTPVAGLWGRLIHTTARHADLTRLTRWAERADRTVERLPQWWAEKQISWLVEAAAISGELHPDEVTTTL